MAVGSSFSFKMYSGFLSGGIPSSCLPHPPKNFSPEQWKNKNNNKNLQKQLKLRPPEKVPGKKPVL